ncbi:MAG: hypothetical protein CMC89_03095 [Flavobacteriaceae bacterium]|nr:hypothetical protein [Flavobacteriaceae bacterium]|tara:strand:- start:746 stop:1693 length:948 start_codon:yes stop_codon:yes gene_type:complete
MNDKELIQKLTDIQTEEQSKKQKINEGASMNISMSGDDAGQVGQLMAIMRNAGMDAKPVAADMPMPMRHDIEKFRSAVDDNPAIPGRDDIPGDMDLQAGALGSAVGGAIGQGITGGPIGSALGSVAGGGGLGGAAGAALGGMAGGPIGSAIGGAIGSKLTQTDKDDPSIPGKDEVPGDQDLNAGALGALAGSLGGGAAGQVLGKGVGDTLGKAIGGAASKMGPTAGKIGTAIGQALPSVGGAAVGGAIGDKLTGEDGDYANSPDEKYAPYSDMVKGGTDLNKSKKSYPKVAGGDNPMALADKIKEELTSLYKEYK